MPSPSSSLATLRPDLAGSMMEFDLQADRNGFVGLRVAPVFEVQKASGNYGKIPVEQLLQYRDTERAPGSGYNRGKFTFLPATFATKEHGAEEPVDDNEATMYRDYFDVELVAALRARDAVLRNHEQRVADLLFNPTTYTGGSLTTGITDEWDDYTNAIPITDVENACRKVWSNSGMWPNSLIINRHVFRNLRLCTQIKNAITSSGAGTPAKASDITIEMLKAVFDLENIIVAGGAKNTANEGANAAFGKIWSDEYAMVCYIDPMASVDHKRPTIARTWHWGEDGSTIGAAIETYRDETVRGDVVRARMQTGEEIVYTELGHLLSNVTT